MKVEALVVSLTYACYWRVSNLRESLSINARHTRQGEDMKQIWMGLSLVAISLCLSGCLEGRGYGGSYETLSPTQSYSYWNFSEALVNQTGEGLMMYPLGSDYRLLKNQSRVDFTDFYPDRVDVSTEDELAAALNVPANVKARWIHVTQNITVDRELDLSGQILLEADQGTMLVFTSAAVLNILPSKSDYVPTLESCVKKNTAAALLASASHLHVRMGLKGPVVLKGIDGLHLTWLYAQVVPDSLTISVRGTVLIDEYYPLTMPLKLDTFDVWIYRGSRTYSENLTHLAVAPEKILADDIDFSSYQALPICQNVQAGTYDYDTYGSALNVFYTACSNGRWNDFASSFASCGGVQ